MVLHTDVDAAVITSTGFPGELEDRTVGIVLRVPVLAITAVKAGMAALIRWRTGGLRAALPLMAALLGTLAAIGAWHDR